MRNVNSEPGAAWTKLMATFTKYGVESPEELFGEGGQDPGSFVDHWHMPYGAWDEVQQALIDAVAESQQTKRGNLTQKIF